ncbi:MAG TPA: caspase family protein, partial [Kofleriaceae bacterium]|nr:caspase family protein [Kofleriaceae bacterium]
MGRISEALYRALPLALTAMLWLTPSWGWAGTKRIAVAVGHNTGAGDQPPLRFAQDDAAKLADVLVELGGVDAADMFLVQGQGAAAVRGALDRARAAITRARAVPDDRVVLTFYYSGHSDGKAIELGKERITYAELRAWLSTTGADVRIAIIDSCKSGALVRPKGANRGPAFDVSMVNELSATGEVILTSAAADEDALESAEIRGSFFTHHLVSGLHGAADASGDGVVTLSEAYGYAFDRTVTSTAAAGAVPQHPTYDYRVAGR